MHREGSVGGNGRTNEGVQDSGVFFICLATIFTHLLLMFLFLFFCGFDLIVLHACVRFCWILTGLVCVWFLALVGGWGGVWF